MWREFLLWRHAGRFGTPDPVFHKDLGFFVFKLGFLRFVFGWTLTALVLTFILVTLAHYFRGGIRPQRKGERFAPPVRAHLSILAGSIVLLKAWGYRLDQFSLLQSNRALGQIAPAQTHKRPQQIDLAKHRILRKQVLGDHTHEYLIAA